MLKSIFVILMFVGLSTFAQQNDRDPKMSELCGKAEVKEISNHYLRQHGKLNGVRVETASTIDGIAVGFNFESGGGCAVGGVSDQDVNLVDRVCIPKKDIAFLRSGTGLPNKFSYIRVHLVSQKNFSNCETMQVNAPEQ